MSEPKEGAIERIVLDKLRAAGDVGVTHFDFTNPPISEARLAEAIENLKNGIFEEDGDDLPEVQSRQTTH